MKFTANAKVFSDAVAHVSRVVETRNTYPILANVHLTADGDSVSLRATDLDIEIKLAFDAAVETGGATTVPAKTLDSLLRKFGKDWDVTLETNDEKAKLAAGRSRLSLYTLSPDSFPDLKTGEFEHRFEMPGADFLRMLETAAFAMSTEETRYYLNGVYMHTVNIGKQPFLRFVATDGHRMARAQTEAPAGAENLPPAIIPRKTVGEIVKLVGKSDTVTIEVSDSKIRITVGPVTLLSKLVEGTFPDYERVTPKNNNKHAIIERGSLKTALDRVSTVASDRGGKGVKFEIKEQTLNLQVDNPDHGSATEEIPVQFDPEEVFEIGFNGRYVTDCLSVLRGDKVRFELNDAGSPAVLTADGADDGVLLVLMPMRV